MNLPSSKVYAQHRNFVKVFANTPEWTYYVMLRLTEAVDRRLAETGCTGSLHPR